MTQSEHDELQALLNKHTWDARPKALEWLSRQVVDTPPEGKNAPSEPLRTATQSNSLFLWFQMIEHEAGNAGVTWNQLVGKTHQLKITKEGLHVMAKQLSEALWGIKSTKDLKKTGHIDDLIDHFVDLFSKVGLTLPEFPSDESKKENNLTVTTRASKLEYPEDIYPDGPTF